VSASDADTDAQNGTPITTVVDDGDTEEEQGKFAESIYTSHDVEPS